MDAYERVLTDAMGADTSLFAREDYVEEAWRIVDPALKDKTPVFEYEPGTWGPKEAAQVAPPGGWINPVSSTDVSTPEVVSTKEASTRLKVG
jgi:glucose-6-phosphate 1-dehydrogenase